MDSRQADRVEVSARASVRQGQGLALSAAVADLTPQGCRLVDIPRSLSRGDMISIRIAGVGPLLAHVRWLKLGREAGLEFDRPLGDSLYSFITGQGRTPPRHGVRAEIMDLHNDFVGDGPADASDPDAATPPALADTPADGLAAIAPQRDLRSAIRIAAANDPAMAVGPQSDPVEVRVLDFSQHGLRIGHDGMDAAPGSGLTLVFPDNQVVTGEVRWNDGSSLGIRVTDLAERPFPANDEPAEQADDPRDPPVAEPEPELEPGDAGSADMEHDLAEPPHERVSNNIRARFASLLEAARALDFVTVTVRADGHQVTMELTMRPPG